MLNKKLIANLDRVLKHKPKPKSTKNNKINHHIKPKIISKRNAPTKLKFDPNK